MPVRTRFRVEYNTCSSLIQRLFASWTSSFTIVVQSSYLRRDHGEGRARTYFGPLAVLHEVLVIWIVGIQRLISN